MGEGSESDSDEMELNSGSVPVSVSDGLGNDDPIELEYGNVYEMKDFACREIAINYLCKPPKTQNDKKACRT
ncbi:hypothetical protein Leryth_023154 [Lithospermum erythrorhizon]|nr:hypothetical protein Leryth_023154 [Lithospermum erythrorhizon]